jgi:hypothetical protein
LITVANPMDNSCSGFPSCGQNRPTRRTDERTSPTYNPPTSTLHSPSRNPPPARLGIYNSFDPL